MLTPEEKEDYQRRIEELKKEQQKLDTPEEKKAKSWLRYTHIGLEFVALFGLGLWAGLQLDKLWQTKPLFLLLGISLGFGLGLYRLIKVANELSQDA